MDWYEIALFALLWIAASWWLSKFGRYKNRRRGDKRGFKKWWQ